MKFRVRLCSSTVERCFLLVHSQETVTCFPSPLSAASTSACPVPSENVFFGLCSSCTLTSVVIPLWPFMGTFWGPVLRLQPLLLTSGNRVLLGEEEGSGLQNSPIWTKSGFLLFCFVPATKRNVKTDYFFREA